MSSDRKTRRPEDPTVTALRNLIKAHEEDERRDLDRRFELLAQVTKQNFKEAAKEMLHPFLEEFRAEIKELKRRVSEIEKRI